MRARLQGVSCMKIQGYVAGTVLALLTGALYFYPLAFVWGYIAQYNPLNDYLLELARNGMPFAYRVVVSIQDFLINLMLMFPLAVIIYRVRPSGTWLYIVVALIACEAAEMFPVWTNLKGYFETVGALEYLWFCSLVMGPALIDYWMLGKRSRAS